MSSKPGTLWIVATPLGNPGDLSPRAGQVLASVSGILAEDTRKTGSLLARCGVKAPAFTSFHDHNEEARLPQALAWLKEGKSLALVSDAGTPLLSDPGYRLVRACRNEGIPVSPIPGPSAPLAALSASGLPPYPFAFLGFAPRKKAEREAFFAPWAAIAATLVFFERKDRLAETLDSAFRALGRREACLARELTKQYEEFLFFVLGEHNPLPELLGEITVVLGPPDERSRSTMDEVETVLREESARGGRMKEVAARAQTRLRGWSAKELYGCLCGLQVNT
ncbi:MAG: 16S rRNA (cytidine(1402)-2'-O)-methyltransferase [Desulfovibrionaceae bacterium]|nr:16S rRNA (cytidine(1402)-2'-O)-methyltransferase [Desulfovibrionaceae bacterium]